MKKLLALLLLIPVITQAELVQQFKNPAFSGVGWSSHVLTIDSIEKSRKDAITSQAKSDADKAAAEALNTPLNRFMSLLVKQSLILIRLWLWHIVAFSFFLKLLFSYFLQFTLLNFFWLHAY